VGEADEQQKAAVNCTSFPFPDPDFRTRDPLQQDSQLLLDRD
jgi:hypothetical protein